MRLQVINASLLLLTAYLNLIAAFRRVLDPAAVAAWRTHDAIWGPDALPFHVAGQVLIAVASVGLVASYARVAERRWAGFRLKSLGGLLAFALLLRLSSGRDDFSLWFIGLVFVLDLFDGRQVRLPRIPFRGRRNAASEEGSVR